MKTDAKQMNKSQEIIGQYIFNDGTAFSLDDKKSGLNNNYLYIGAPGTGKTRSEFYNILHQLDRSHVIVDVKGSMASLAPILKKEGYQVFYLNLIDPHHSMSYNPLDNIRSDYDTLDISSIARALYSKKRVHGDPYWDESAILFLQAALTYTYEANTSSNNNGSLQEAIDILDTITIDDNNSLNSEVLDECLDELNEADLNVNSINLFKRLFINSPNTLACVLNTLRTSIAPLQNPDILKLLSDNNEENKINFRRFVSSKSVIFIQLDDSDITLHPIAGVFLTQLFQFLYAEANRQDDFRLTIPVQFHLDDMATYTINNFESIIATARSRGIGITGCIQSKNQLSAAYGDNAINIQDCFDTTIYMGTNSYDSALDIANRSGFTLDYVNTLPVGDIILMRRGTVAKHLKLLDYSASGKYFIYNYKKYTFPKSMLNFKYTPPTLIRREKYCDIPL